ncbi:3-oxoacyl-[acyl-carrier-protein] synthase [Tulasnella sp. 427]|nr:3-oxoacyl-[acyl-carrier-protein] synthase [Tulasnella sp. 427]
MVNSVYLSVIMVTDMTRKTVKTGSDFHIELVNGGHYNAKALRAKVEEIQSKVPAGVGIAINALYITQDSQFGSISASGKSLSATKIIGASQATRIKHVAFKPESADGIRQVVTTAAANPTFPTSANGDGWSCRISLVAGTSFGGSEDVWPYIFVAAVAYRMQRIPFDGVLYASCIMVDAEAHTSLRVKKLIPRCRRHQVGGTSDKNTGGSELGARPQGRHSQCQGLGGVQKHGVQHVRGEALGVRAMEPRFGHREAEQGLLHAAVQVEERTTYEKVALRIVRPISPARLHPRDFVTGSTALESTNRSPTPRKYRSRPSQADPRGGTAPAMRVSLNCIGAPLFALISSISGVTIKQDGDSTTSSITSTVSPLADWCNPTPSKEFPWKLWLGDFKTLPSINLRDAFTGPEAKIKEADIQRFYAVIGSDGEFSGASALTRNKHRWILPLSPAGRPSDVHGDLLKSAHVSNGFKLAPGIFFLQGIVLLVRSHQAAPLLSGTRLFFQTGLEYRYEDTTSHPEISVTGKIFVRHNRKQLVPVSTVGYGHGFSHNNLVLAFLRCRGAPDAIFSQSENGGYSLTSSKYDVHTVGMVVTSDRLEVKLKHAGMNNGRSAILVETVNGCGEKVLMGIAEVAQAPTAFSSPTSSAVWEAADEHLLAVHGFPIVDIVKNNPKAKTSRFGGMNEQAIRSRYVAMIHDTMRKDGAAKTLPLPREPRRQDFSLHFRPFRWSSMAPQIAQTALCVAEKAAIEDKRCWGMIHSALASIADAVPIALLVNVAFY